MSLPGLIHPIRFSSEVLWRDYGAMMLFTLALLVFAYLMGRGRVSRPEGCILLAGYSGYLGLLYYMAAV
jgi:cation:H+ antiporter